MAKYRTGRSDVKKLAPSLFVMLPIMLACGFTRAISYVSAPVREIRVFSAVTSGPVIYMDYQNIARPSTATVAAFRASDGTLLWKEAIPSVKSTSTLTSELLIDGNYLILAQTNAGATKFDLATFQTSDGTLLWSKPAVAPVASLVAQGGALYGVARSGQGYYAVSLINGQQLWSDSLPSTENGANLFGPLVNEGVMYIGSDTGDVIAINASNGAVVWKRVVIGMPVPGAAPNITPIAVLAGTLYVNAPTGLLRVRPADGSIESITANSDLQALPVDGAHAVYALRVGSNSLYSADLTRLTVTVLDDNGQILGHIRFDGYSPGNSQFVGYAPNLIFEKVDDSIVQALGLSDDSAHWAAPLGAGQVAVAPGYVFVSADGISYPPSASTLTPKPGASATPSLAPTLTPTFSPWNTATPSVSRAPILTAFNDADGSVAWTRTLVSA
jgi:outer membrane protein assembly factor BamB